MYNEQMMLSLKKVEANRAANTELQPRRMTADEKDELLRTYHPDYRVDQFSELVIGPNKGERVPHELAALLQAESRIRGVKLDLENPDYDTDVLSSAAAAQVLPQLSRLIRRVRALPSLPSSAWVTQTQ